jgi:hypothetical protein
VAEDPQSGTRTRWHSGCRHLGGRSAGHLVRVDQNAASPWVSPGAMWRPHRARGVAQERLRYSHRTRGKIGIGHVSLAENSR